MGTIFLVGCDKDHVSQPATSAPDSSNQPSTADQVESNIENDMYSDTGSCDSSVWFCEKSDLCPSTIANGKGIIVAKTDAPEILSWKNTNDDCIPPQCSVSSNGEVYLVSNKIVDLSNYPAQNYCRSIGGRLPTIEELLCINMHQKDFGPFNLDPSDESDLDVYWTSAASNPERATNIAFAKGDSEFYKKMNGSTTNDRKTVLASVRCIKN